MSYVQIEHNGQKYGLKFNNKALRHMQDKLSLDDLSKDADYALVWGGLVGNAYAKEIELGMTFEQVCDLVDGLDKETIDKIDKAFQESQAYKKLIEDKEDDKKKLTEQSIGGNVSVSPLGG